MAVTLIQISELLVVSQNTARSNEHKTGAVPEHYKCGQPKYVYTSIKQDAENKIIRLK